MRAMSLVPTLTPPSQESILNRNANSITVRSDPLFAGDDMVTVPPSDSKPGSREEQVKDGGMDFIGNRR